MTNQFLEESFKEAGYRKFRHNSGAISWSKENLCEYSDEFEEITSDLANA